LNRARVALVTLAFATTLAVTADARLARTGTPQVAFHASGPAGMKIVGQTSDLDIDDQGARIVIKVPLRNLATGISLRDDHMRNKYLQVGSFPNAELSVDRATIHFPNGDGVSSGDASGTMAIHGKTKNVSFHYNVARTGGALHVGGTTKLDIRDYGIDIPSYLGVTVKPDIDVEVQFTATE
jgi:predicted outer membrane repeat protein